MGIYFRRDNTWMMRSTNNKIGHSYSIDFPPYDSWRSVPLSLWDLETYVNFIGFYNGRKYSCKNKRDGSQEQEVWYSHVSDISFENFPFFLITNMKFIRNKRDKYK